MVLDNKRYLAYIESKEWKEKRTKRLSLDHYRCCVCGRKATEVHHLTYDHFMNEPMEDLVSLCHDCHMEAENIYDPVISPRTAWDSRNAAFHENSFMAAMRIDAENISHIVFDYLTRVRGTDFEDFMELRHSTEKGKKDDWGILRKAVDALCRKRYINHADDRKDIAIRMISNHTIVSVCLAVIEHNNRNYIQASLNDIVVGMKDSCKTWKKVSEELNVPYNLILKLKNDDGSTGGPTLRESVLYYCAMDAVSGIYPQARFMCLTKEDYGFLNYIADYITHTTGIDYSSKEANDGN